MCCAQFLPVFFTCTEMENFYEEIKYYLVNGGYHNLTISHAHPDSRKAVIRKAAKKYMIKGREIKQKKGMF